MHTVNPFAISHQMAGRARIAGRNKHMLPKLGFVEKLLAATRSINTTTIHLFVTNDDQSFATKHTENEKLNSKTLPIKQNGTCATHAYWNANLSLKLHTETAQNQNQN
ncbi:unnamed protein product [Ectocarpus sp. 4 AP-2014]